MGSSTHTKSTIMKIEFLLLILKVFEETLYIVEYKSCIFPLGMGMKDF